MYTQLYRLLAGCWSVSDFFMMSKGNWILRDNTREARNSSSPFSDI